MKKEETFPSFRRQNKWLGIIDYKSLIVFGIYILAIYQTCGFLKLSLKVTVVIVIMSIIPIIAIYFTSTKEESVIDVIFVVMRFCFSKKTYYYMLEEREEFDIKTTRKKTVNINIEKILKKLKI